MPPPRQARIPFADRNGVRSFHVQDRQTVFIEDSRHNWYRADLLRPLASAIGNIVIGLDTNGLGTFSRHSSIVVEGEVYPLRSLVRIDGEPLADDGGRGLMKQQA